MDNRFRRATHSAAIGIVAAGAALVLQYLLHQLNHDLPFPPFALGDWFIRIAPGQMATAAVERFDHYARIGLAAGMMFAWVAGGGAIAVARPSLTVAFVFVATLLASMLAPIEPEMADALLAATAGAVVAGLLVTATTRLPTQSRRESPRRRALLMAGLAGGTVLVTGVAFATRRKMTAVDAPLAPVRLDLADDPAFAAPDGISTRITPNADHYTVDINLTRPRQDGAEWRLELGGLVATPRRVAYADLAALPLQERAIFLQCISNVANGDLMSCATWTVTSLRGVLGLAGVLDGADTVVARAIDGFHESYPLDAIDGIYVAVGMGGEAVPSDHGSPVRLLYPGHYGMRSIKWLTELEVIRGEEPGYWQSRGWDKEAVVRTGARIDTPHGGDVPGGTVVLGGVAWGATQAMEVEVSGDGGSTWQPAQLEAPVDELSWVRWRAELALAPGEHQVAARAIAGGATQADTHTDPHPSGASGYHRITITVPG